jgi:PqqD family protein of HPr-rel-A system
VAVLNVESGDTHLLSRQGADLLERIRREPGVGEGKLAAMVAAGPEGPKMVRAALAELRRLRLVEAVPD